MDKKVIVNDWKNVVSLLRDWHNSYVSYTTVFGNQYSEELDVVYDKELALMLAIKSLLKTHRGNHFKTNDLNEDEKIVFFNMVEKSKSFSLSTNKNYPYTKTLFLPVVAWNDDPNETEPTRWEKGSVLKMFREVVIPFLEEMVSESRSLPHQKMSIEVPEVLNYEKVEDLINQGVDLYTMEEFGPYLKDLCVFPQEDWIRAGLIPISISGEDYMSIADFSFNSIGSDYKTAIEEYMEVNMRGFRLTEEAPDELDVSLVNVENLLWKLSSEEYFTAPLCEDAVIRECIYTVLLHKEEFVRLDVTIEDRDAENNVVHSLDLSRKLNNASDYVLSLPHFVINEDFVWSVGFAQIEEADLKEEHNMNNVKNINETSLTELNSHVPFGTVWH